MIRALDILSFLLCLLGWLALGLFGTWQETAPFWLGAPLLWAALLFGVFTLRQGLRGRLSRSCAVSVLVFTAYILGRALMSDVAYLARQDVVFCATAFIGWVLTAVRYERPRQRFALITVWSLLILANLGMGIYQIKVNDGATALGFLGVARDARDAQFGGLFPNSNHLCGFMELSAFILLAIAVFGRVHSFVRVLCGLVFVAASFCVVESTSRAGSLAFGFGVAVFGGIAWVLHLIRNRHGNGRRISFGLPLAVVGVALLAISGLAWYFLNQQFGTGKVLENLNGRTQIWSRALEQWTLSPVTGTGARSFEYYEPSFRDLRIPWVTWNDTDVDAIFAHNDWVQLLADYGLIGLVLAVAVLGLHFWKAIAFLRADTIRAAKSGGGLFTDYRGAVMLGVVCGMIPFAVHCFGDFQMHIGINAVLAAAVLGLMANPGEPDTGVWLERGETASKGRALKGMTLLAAAAPAVAMAWHVPAWAEGDYKYQMARGVFTQTVDNPDAYFTAASDMKSAVDVDPLNYEAWNHWGMAEAGSAALLGGNPVFLKASIERFKAAHELHPYNAVVSSNIATTYDALRNNEEAEHWFQLAIRWARGSRLIHWRYANFLMRTGKYEEASALYWAVVQRYEPTTWQRASVQRSLDRSNELLRRRREIQGTPP